MNINGYEIERKFLIAYPNIAELRERAQSSRIEQTYLINPEPEVTERVRLRESAGEICFTHTLKRRVSSARSREDEREISRDEYLLLLTRADPNCRTIIKERFCLEYRGRAFEIDIYPFWSDRAVMEIELSDESERVEFPPETAIIRELTGEKCYSNASLSRSIPCEPLVQRGTKLGENASYSSKKD